MLVAEWLLIDWQVKLYGRPIDEIRPLIKEIKELRVIVDEAEAQFAGLTYHA